MDLPPDKAKLLKSYDDDKKWDLICDQVRCFKFDTGLLVIIRARLCQASASTLRQ